MNQVKNESGFVMPAEWEKHSAVWLAWPHDRITFGSLNEKDNKINSERLTKVEENFKEIVNLLQEGEQVRLITQKEKIPSGISSEIEIFHADYADVWTRDYIPSFVKDENGKLVAVKWKYNAYGEKFAGLIKDNEVWYEVNKKQKIKTIETDLILELGAIETNGTGVLLTTEECIHARNPELSKEEVENIFKTYLGIEKVVWLKNGLVNDHTDGHIDELAKFVATNKIVCAYEDDPNDENFKILDDNYQVLKNSTDQNGKTFEIIKLPMPHITYGNGSKAPASYANFYIGNKVVLASVFNDPNDEKALKIIRECFPDRKVVGIDCREIIYGGGAIHCMTQQQPAV